MSYYKILGVQPTATDKEIKDAYRQKAKCMHPDSGGNENDFKKINEAYEILKDPNKKAAYDHKRFVRLTSPGGFSININDLDGNLHDMFNDIHSGPFKTYHRQHRNKDLNVNLTYTLTETLTEQEKNISIKHVNGNREIVQINIPMGVDNGTRIRYNSLGDASIKGIQPGDLYVTINIPQSKELLVENQNVYKYVTINCFEAVLGTSVTVQNLEDKTLQVTVPAGTQHGTSLVLKQQGLFKKDTNNRGNFIVVVLIKIPENLSDKQLQILRGMKIT